MVARTVIARLRPQAPAGSVPRETHDRREQAAGRHQEVDQLLDLRAGDVSGHHRGLMAAAP
jgi:hypothetical protein